MNSENYRALTLEVDEENRERLARVFCWVLPLMDSCMDRGYTFELQDTRALRFANFQKACKAMEALHVGEQSMNQFIQLDLFNRFNNDWHATCALASSECISISFRRTIFSNISHFKPILFVKHRN